MIICSLIIIFFIAVSRDLLKDLGDITYPWNYPIPQILFPIAVFILTILTIITTWIGLGCKCRSVHVEYDLGMENRDNFLFTKFNLS
ncbi:hypothetical protein U3516DRAFT_758082 [Neocallimastix sp. 'constans']|jgi:hypothetical protein